MLVLQKPNSEQIKMYREIIGATGMIFGVGYAVYIALTGDHGFSYSEGALAAVPVLLGGIIATFGKKDSTSTEGDNALERKVVAD